MLLNCAWLWELAVHAETQKSIEAAGRCGFTGFAQRKNDGRLQKKLGRTLHKAQTFQCLQVREAPQGVWLVTPISA